MVILTKQATVLISKNKRNRYGFVYQQRLRFLLFVVNVA